MTKDSEFGLAEPTEETENKTVAASHAPELELDKYRGEIADLHLTEDQEREFLETLWSILSDLVRLGFDVDICGHILGEYNSASGALPDALDSKEHKIIEETPSNGQREEDDHD